MSIGLQLQSTGRSQPIKPAQSTGVLLQRACACGGSAGLKGECDECDQNRLSLQRSTQNSDSGTSKSPSVPPIVHDVLRSPGQPLDTDTRAFFEPRFGHDFSAVRVHSDGEAATSAQMVNASAYTVGAHVVFNSGEFAPSTMSGRRILAHELTHVLQQRGGSAHHPTGIQSLALGTAGDVYEQEADRIAQSVMENGAPVRGSVSTAQPAVVQRQPPPPAQPAPAQPPAPVPPVAPNQTQQATIETARAAAAIRTQSALLRLRGIVPAAPPGRDDPSARARTEAIRLARIIFAWPNPNMDQIEEIVSHIVARLAQPQVMVAGANDPECGSREAYVINLSPPIILCPAFFADTPEQQIRTMIHEAAHLAGIGNAGLGEGYCMVFDCQGACGNGFDAADSWAQYVHCVSGRTPDQPPVVQGQPRQPPPGGGTP